MDYVRIGKLVKKTKQVKPDELGRTHFTYVDISSIDRELKVISEAQYLPVDEAPSRARKSIENNDVLVSTVRPNLNAVALVTEEYHQEIASTGFCVLRPIPECLDEHYLFYLTQTSDFVDYLVWIATGASYPAVSDSDILRFEIPLPPLDEQKRIAAILEEADHARRTRRFTQSVSDTFLQEVFVEMFGDPVTNPMGWEEHRLRELSILVTDGEHATPQRSELGIKLLSARNIQNGYLDYEAGLDFVPEHEFERIRKRIEPQVGDVLMSCSGTVGRVTTIHVYEPMAMVRSVALIRPRMDKIEPLFLEHFLRSERGQQLIRIGTNTSSQGNIFQNQISKLLIQLPPFSLQRKFTEIVHHEQKMKHQQHESARQAEHLFQTLLHRAFRGEV